VRQMGLAMTHDHTTTAVAIGERPLHPRHGLHAPRASTPERRPNSIRRTYTIDTVRPGDILGEIVQTAVLRDLHTAADGTTTVLQTAEVHTQIDFQAHFALLEITSDPPRERLHELVGRSVSTGFRAAVAGLLPDDVEQATALYSLLDDLPGAALVSGVVIGVAGRISDLQRSGPKLQIEGLCAGFQAGGSIMVEIDAGHHSPTVTGPQAPSLTNDDPLAWHAMRSMGPHDARRLRRLDVLPGATPDAPVEVEVYFRDSHVDEHGSERVVHEYSVTALVDPASQTVIRSSAVAHSLPWLECIQAEASGDRLAGRPLRGLRPHVREELIGITTCTHLNDTLRSIEDVRAILQMF
ncbi:MAG: DUF2889 domain-containing protein, partial [Actinobacteria bacterium]|nr:DUF2889 domain-containing protein [Actinomycetota bacterium]